MSPLHRVAERRAARAEIADPERHTTMDGSGAVRSIQAANVTMPESELDAIWTPMHLERLARTYWRYLSRVTLGLIRVAYTESERFVVLVARPFVLLRFRAPEYHMSAGRGIVRWRIRSGVLVARRGHEGDGYLEIDVRRTPAEQPGFARAHVEVEVANFYPAIATWVARWFYKATQSRIHVLVTHGFLRSLAKLELEESAVGRFASLGGQDGADGGGPPASWRAEAEPEEARTSAPFVTVGDTPWLVVGGLAAAAAAVAVALLVRARRSQPSR